MVIRSSGTAASVLRQWWPLVVLIVTVAAVVGLLVGSRAPLSSTILYRVDPTATDSSRVTQSTQTAARVLGSPLVFQTAAGPATDVAEFRRDIDVAVVPSSELVSVTARCPAPETCAAKLDAMRRSIDRTLTSTTQEQLKTISASGLRALGEGRLPEIDSERARRVFIGQRTAERQSAAANTGTSLTLLGPATTAEYGTLNPMSGAAFGALGGSLLAALALFFLCGRRGRVRRPHDWSARVARGEVIREIDLGRLARIVVDGNARFVVIGSVRDDVSDVVRLRDAVHGHLVCEGFTPLEVQEGHVTREHARGCPVSRFIGARTRHRLLGEHGCDVLVLSLADGAQGLDVVEENGGVVVAALDSQRPHYQVLRRFLSRSGAREPLLVCPG